MSGKKKTNYSNNNNEENTVKLMLKFQLKLTCCGPIVVEK